MKPKRRYLLLVLAAFFVQLFSTRVGDAANVTVAVDANANQHAISPLIYGVAFGDGTSLPDLNCPIERWGGNATSNYNWQNNASNHASDWYFQSIPGSNGTTVSGDADVFIRTAKAASTQAMMTIPMMDWVAKLVTPDSTNNGGRTWSFDTQKYGAQQQVAPDIPNGRAGNGVLSNGQNVTGNDPNDAYVPSSPTYQQGWVQHLVSQFGLASAGGLKYYILDNETGIWQSTHRDVHPIGAHDTEIRDRIIAASAMIKSVDPGAQVVGPEEWGWSGYLYSGFDVQSQAWGNLPDHDLAGHGDYMPWLLSQIKAHDNLAPSSPHTLDVFSLHFYPQGGEYSSDTSANTQLLRNRSTRGLWDPNYVNESWIGTQVQLIPRMRNWVNANYFPGTKIAITEYSWGAEDHINGATTEADILGIFGRENLDMATYWTVPDPAGPAYKAFKMYRNYDGNKSTFGDTSVSARAPSPDDVSAFAALRSADGALTVMVINKDASANSVNVSLANFSASATAQLWQLTSVNQIARQADVAVSGNAISVTVPAQSITLFVVPGSGSSVSSCDLNGDGSTNVSDVQICVNQAIGATACSTGDINKDGVCNVIDVQRDVNAALGGACVTQ